MTQEKLPITSSFADWLDDRMQELGISNAELGRRVGVSSEMIRQYKRGAVPGADKLRALERALSVHPGSLSGLVAGTLSDVPLEEERRDLTQTLQLEKEGLGERIRTAREANGMSPEQLAEATGVDARSVYRWEAGDNAPFRKTLLKVAGATGVNSDWLLTGEGEMLPPFPSDWYLSTSPREKEQTGPVRPDARTPVTARTPQAEQGAEAAAEAASQSGLVVEVLMPDGENVWFEIEMDVVRVRPRNPLRVQGRTKRD